MGAADRPTVWVERVSNPFLLREWRRAHRHHRTPLTGPLIICTIVAVLFGSVALAAHAFSVAESGSLSMVGSSGVGDAARLFGVWLIGAGAWLALGLAYQLSLSQTQFEEQQATLDLVLVTPMRRGRMVGQLLAWPALNIFYYLTPLLPLLGCLMPLLGLSFWGALRVGLVIFGTSLLVMMRAPSGAGTKPERHGRAGANAVLVALAAAIFVAPLVSHLAAAMLGIPGFGVLRWPLTMAELLATRRPFWGASTWLAPWMVGLFVLVLLARWLAAWGRLSQTDEVRPPAAFAGVLAWFLLAYVIAGLWWPRQSVAASERLWGGLHLVALATLVAAAVAEGGPYWLFVGTLADRSAAPVARACWRLVDSILVIAFGPLIWLVGTRQVGGSATPDWTVTVVTFALAMALSAMAQTVERTGRMRSGERANTRGSFLVRAFTRLAVAGWIVWGVVAAGRAATSAGGLPYGWTPQLFAWPVELTAIVAAIGLVGTLLPAWFDRARGGAGREGSEPRIWRGLPGRWRENALVVRAHRSTWRLMVRMPALGFWLLGGVGLSLPWLTTLMRHNGLPRTGGSLALGILREISYFGRDLGHLFMVSPLEPHQSVLLAEIVLLTMVVAPIATVVAAGGAGRIVARERSSGSLGFLLLTDLTHREVAEGLLVGQLAPLIEMITVVSLTLLLWAISAGDLGILAIGSLAALLLWGLVLMASGLAFIAGARYARRADGAPEAMSMLLLVHGTAFIALRVTTESWPESFGWNWMLCAAAVWVVLSAWYGWLAWAACPGAVARLRRLTAIGQAFDQATRRD